MSIKIEELSVGNWVQVGGKPKYINPKSDSIGAGIVYFESTHSASKIQDIHPLPITPENLALIGFDTISTIKREFGVDVMKCGNSSHKNQIYVCIDGPLCTLHLYKRGFNVNSIHHLQNILQVMYGITLTHTVS